MKSFWQLATGFMFFLLVQGETTIEKVGVKILDPAKGKSSVKINPGPPKSVDVDIESMIEAKDITVSLFLNLLKFVKRIKSVQIRFGFFSLIDGKYNEFIEADSVRVCDMSKSENPLIAFVYKEMVKKGNMTTACPVRKGSYYLHGFTIDEGDLPISIPSGNFKIELNGTIHEEDKDSPLFIADIFFTES